RSIAPCSGPKHIRPPAPPRSGEPGTEAWRCCKGGLLLHRNPSAGCSEIGVRGRLSSKLVGPFCRKSQHTVYAGGVVNVAGNSYRARLTVLPQPWERAARKGSPPVDRPRVVDRHGHGPGHLGKGSP